MSILSDLYIKTEEGNLI